jgi:hypothetical protein
LRKELLLASIGVYCKLGMPSKFYEGFLDWDNIGEIGESISDFDIEYMYSGLCRAVILLSTSIVL